MLTFGRSVRILFPHRYFHMEPTLKFAWLIVLIHKTTADPEGERMRKKNTIALSRFGFGAGPSIHNASPFSKALHVLHEFSRLAICEKKTVDTSIQAMYLRWPPDHVHLRLAGLSVTVKLMPCPASRKKACRLCSSEVGDAHGRCVARSIHSEIQRRR